ncbi:MAG: KH domain-containing protein [Veillonellaceae bacterium]|nr:KH domain-containing protein [Veillonellaceae bacterium]
MQELVEVIAKALVRKPEEVRVELVSKGSLDVYELHVAPEDMGKVIGRRGRIAKALRTVVRAGAVKENRKVTVDII